MIYLVHEDRYCGGGYDADYFNLGAAVGGESVDKMIDESYDVLKAHMEDEDYRPFILKISRNLLSLILLSVTMKRNN